MSHRDEGSPAITNHRAKVKVVGVGNLLLKDEGIGVHVAQVLQKMPLPSNIDLEIIDGGTSPYAFQLLEEVDKLIIVDAAKGGGKPGEIYRFHPEDITLESQGMTSVHQVGPLQSLRMMEYAGTKPKSIVIIGIEPQEIDYGLDLSPKLQKKIPKIIELVLKETGINH